MNSKAKEIYDALVKKFPEALEPITKLSKNTSGAKNFIISEYLAFNFDLINNVCFEHPNCKEKSPDALFFHNNVLYFIEFKEGDVKKEDVRLKIHEAIISLYHFAMVNKIAIRDDFINIDIRYAIVMRDANRGSPPKSFLDTLESTAKYFNLKNLEGLLIKQTKIAFQPKTIVNLLNKISNGGISSIKIVSSDQTVEDVVEVS